MFCINGTKCRVVVMPEASRNYAVYHEDGRYVVRFQSERVVTPHEDKLLTVFNYDSVPQMVVARGVTNGATVGGVIAHELARHAAGRFLQAMKETGDVVEAIRRAVEPYIDTARRHKHLLSQIFVAGETPSEVYVLAREDGRKVEFFIFLGYRRNGVMYEYEPIYASFKDGKLESVYIRLHYLPIVSTPHIVAVKSGRNNVVLLPAPPGVGGKPVSELNIVFDLPPPPYKPPYGYVYDYVSKISTAVRAAI